MFVFAGALVLRGSRLTFDLATFCTAGGLWLLLTADGSPDLLQGVPAGWGEEQGRHFGGAALLIHCCYHLTGVRTAGKQQTFHKYT